MNLRARLLALAVGVALLLATGVTLLVTSRTPQCGVVAPRPSLAPSLRALGDFDQAYDAGNTMALEDAASRAAAALHPALIGTAPQTPVAVRAARPGDPDALVVPLRARPASGQEAPLAGLVVFLRDCAGNAYFSTAEDDTGLQPPLLQFPGVSRDQASARLGDAGIGLAYSSSPLQPAWVVTASPGQSMSAR